MPVKCTVLPARTVIGDQMQEDQKTVRRRRPIGRLVLVLLVIVLLIATIAYLLNAGSEEIFFADDLAGAPPLRALSELGAGEEAQAAILKRDALGGVDEFVLTDRRLIRIRDQDRWFFPLARWSGFGVYTGDGRIRFRLSTIEDHEITISVEATPVATRFEALLSEAYATRPTRDETTPASEIPAPRRLRPFEHPSMGYAIWLAPLVLFLLGFWVLSIGLRRLRNARYRIRHQQRSAGTVVDHIAGSFQSAQGRSETVYHPVIEFTTLQGRQVTFKSGLGTGRKQPVGHAVKVLYDPQTPEEAMVYAFGPLYFVPIVAGILGLGTVIWAGALVWLILSEL